MLCVCVHRVPLLLRIKLTHNFEDERLGDVPCTVTITRRGECFHSADCGHVQCQSQSLVTHADEHELGGVLSFTFPSFAPHMYHDFHVHVDVSYILILP